MRRLNRLGLRYHCHGWVAVLRIVMIGYTVWVLKNLFNSNRFSALGSIPNSRYSMLDVSLLFVNERIIAWRQPIYFEHGLIYGGTLMAGTDQHSLPAPLSIRCNA
ncbi:hypothetical protein OH492_10035 [Vibrio chagasii]|nr:hypothetical protein [Vibrio chagasii]